MTGDAQRFRQRRISNREYKDKQSTALALFKESDGSDLIALEKGYVPRRISVDSTFSYYASGNWAEVNVNSPIIHTIAFVTTPVDLMSE